MSSSSSSLNVQASWGDQDFELPDVSGNLGGAAGAPAAAISYASCTKKNLPEQDVELTPEEKDLYDRYLSSSKFEKDNFHPYNTPPDCPCSAFFHLPEHFTTVKDIFDGLLRDGIPATFVRCLQRLPNDGVLVTFSSEEVRNRFLRKSSLIIRKRISVVHPASRRLTFVNVYHAPYELPDSAIEERLKPYGTIYSHRRGKCQGYPDVFNRVRHLRMALEDDIPCFLRFSRFQVRVKYENQPKTCRKCNSPDHLAKEWTAVACFNCDGTGHLSRSCPDGMRCCICKSKEHVAVDCIHSWYRRPQTIDLADDLATGDPEDALDGRPVGDGPPPPLEELPEDPPAASNENASPQPTDNSAAPPSSAEVHVLDSQGLVLPNTPDADEVLADLFASNDDVNDDGDEGDEGEFSTADDDEQLETDEEDSETEDPDTATEASTTPSLTENAALAAVFKKTRKNVKKRLGDRLPQRGGSDRGPPARKATRPALVTSRKAGPK